MRRIALALGFALLLAGCGLSPAEPTELETQPVFIMSPGTARRISGFVLYSTSFAFSVPSGGTDVTVRSLEFTIIGPNGDTYSTQDHGGFRIGPATTISGSGGSFWDTNTTRPLATRVRGRAVYTSNTGASVTVERTSTIQEQ